MVFYPLMVNIMKYKYLIWGDSMREFIGLMDILLYDTEIPHIYKQDVAKRVNDWCGAGGKETDDYVKNQYYYLLRIRDMIENKGIIK